MHIDVFTLFPAMFTGPLTESIVKRAQEMEALAVDLIDIRTYTTGKHRMADDVPYGGGGGMVMKVEPVVAAVEDVLPKDTPVLLMTPQGKVFDQAMAQELAQLDRFGIICGHYEGFDERIRQLVVTREVSIGDYVLTGGELAAMVIIDAVARLQPNVLGDPDAPAKDSHATGLLEHPHYTRPPTFRGLDVPPVLTSGHQAKIDTWRRQQAIRRTWQRRPELLHHITLSEDERWLLAELARETADG